MTRRSSLIEAFMPWAGLTIGLLALIAVHQFGSDGTFDHCGSANPGPVLVVAFLGLVVCAFAGIVSWRATREKTVPASRRVIGLVSVGSAALFAFAIVLAIIASLVLPPCFG